MNIKFDKLFFFKKFFILILFVFQYGCNKDTTSKKPNILFIMSDDFTSQAWGIYGGILKDYVHTPNIKKLAQEGVMLNNAFCTNSICVPSRASILTGQYSNKNGVYTLADFLSPDSLNIAKVLKKSGYQTAVVGKWHLKKEPSGFDYYNILEGQGRYWDPIFRTKENFHKESNQWHKYGGYSTDIIKDLSLQWLDSRDNKSKPFFLMVHFKATHEPFDYPDRFKDLYKDVYIPEPKSILEFSSESSGRTFKGQQLEVLAERWRNAYENPDDFWTSYPGLPFLAEGLDSIKLRKKIYQKLVKDFMRCGAAVDDNLGKILEYLKENGLSDNTVVIQTADQGYFLGEHGFFDKRMIYEESLRMPLVIRYPKEIKAGWKLDDIILNIDFPALIADYAGVVKPESMQGKSFRSNLKGKTPNNWRTSAYYRYWQHYPIRPAHFGLRNKRYKLAFFYGHGMGLKGVSKIKTTAAWEFYDLQNDPYESYNVYHDSKYKDVIKKMKSELHEQRKYYEDEDKHSPHIQQIIKESWDE